MVGNKKSYVFSSCPSLVNSLEKMKKLTNLFLNLLNKFLQTLCQWFIFTTILVIIRLILLYRKRIAYKIGEI